MLLDIIIAVTAFIVYTYISLHYDFRCHELCMNKTEELIQVYICCLKKLKSKFHL